MDTPSLTTLGKPFQPPVGRPSFQQTTVPGTSVPVCISSQADPLDLHYSEIELPVDAVPPCGESIFNVITHEHFPLIFRPQESVDIRVPIPHHYSSLQEYTEALREWFTRTSKFFGFARLPNPISGVFHLPELPKIFTTKEKADPGKFRTFSATQWPLLPENYLDMLDHVFNRKPIIPTQPFNDQVPKRELICYKHHITDQPQWPAQLITPEPLPLLYDSYDDYKQAYDQWAGLSYHTLDIPIIPVPGFEQIAGLGVYRPHVIETRRCSDAPLRVREVCPHPRLIERRLETSWAPPLSGEIARNFWQENPKSSGKPPQLSGFGVNEILFLNEHQKYGYCWSSFEGKPVKKAIVRSAGGSANVSSLCALLKDSVNYDLSFVKKLIEADLSLEQFEYIMRFEINGTRTCAFISQILNNAVIIGELVAISQLCEQYRFRISFLMTAVFRLDNPAPLLKTLFVPTNLTIFHYVVAFLNLTSLYRIPLLGPIPNANPTLQTINRLYLLSVLLSVLREAQSAQWYRDTLDPCRDLIHEIPDSFHAYMYRTATPGTDNYTALLMILSTDSTQLHRFILGNDYLKWMSPRLLMRIEHSRIVVPAARSFLMAISDHVYEPFADWVSELPKHAIAFVDSACSALRNHALTYGVHLPAPPLLSLLDIVLSADEDDVGSLILPLARLLSDRRVMSGFDDRQYQDKLVADTCWLCTRLRGVSRSLYRARVRGLTLLAHDERTCLEIYRHGGGFPEFIVGHLSESEPQLMHINWGFFNGWTKYDRVLTELLSSQVKESLPGIPAIVGRDSNEVLKKFFEWSIDLWRNRNQTIVTLFCELMMPTIGRVTSMFRIRKTMFKGDERLVALIEKYAKAIADLTVPGAERFMEAFGKHMDPKDDIASRRGWMRFRQSTQRILSAAIEKELL
jgi:hypothetical protein